MSLNRLPEVEPAAVGMAELVTSQPTTAPGAAPPGDGDGEEPGLSRIEELAQAFASTAPSEEVRAVRYRQRRVRLLGQSAMLAKEQQVLLAQRASQTKPRA